MPHRLGPVGLSMVGKPARERSRLAARALAKDWNDRRRLGVRAAWEVGGLVVVAGRVVEDDGVLVIDVEVRNGQGVRVRFENPLKIVNPRLLAPTGEFEEMINEDGAVVQREICAEDPGEALRLMVLDQVRLQCLRS